MTTILYKKDSKGNVLQWMISFDNDSDYPTLVISNGQLNKNLKTFTIPVTMTTATLEIDSRIKVKRSDGWKSAEDLKINENDPNFEKLLLRRLPTNIKDLSNRYKPQKAIPFKEGSFIYPAYIQKKINGVRCTIGWEVIIRGEGLFAEEYEGVVIRSKEGYEYILPDITKSFTKECFIFEDKELVYDGELYIHNKPLNYIRASIPMVNNRGTVSKTTNPPDKVQFWTFDLSIPNVSQLDRTNILEYMYNKYFLGIGTIKLVKSQIVNSDTEALKYADIYINEGFEGGILRNLESEYKFGRSNNMMKLKKWYYTKCTILDIVLKNEISVNDNIRTYISFILKNDLNNETFDASPLGNEEDRLSYINERDNLIGKLVQIRFRERSGIKKVPFQGTIIKILD